MGSSAHGGGYGITQGLGLSPARGMWGDLPGLISRQEHSSESGHSPQAHEEHKGDEEGPQRDTVPQVVDDDGNVVVQLALLLGGGRWGGDQQQPWVPPQTHLLHHITSESCTANFGSFFRKELEPTWCRTLEMELEGDMGGWMGLMWMGEAPIWPCKGLRHFISYPCQGSWLLPLHQPCAALGHPQLIVWGNPAVIKRSLLAM